jgi:hypothetical protein
MIRVRYGGDKNKRRRRKMEPIYIVLKSGAIEASRINREEALEIGREVSGYNIGIPIAEAEVWEIEVGERQVLIWSVTWESEKSVPVIFKKEMETVRPSCFTE